MDPDPIRRAFEALYGTIESQVDDKSHLASRFVGFTAGAKWVALKAAELCKQRADEFRMRLDTGVRLDWLDVSKEEADHCADVIRKHFGVED